ncbi:hypothetical protein V1477_003653 [Vespula maculifrons]|uniref:Uncharacterized protein n=1 Tax=Vespula maculifrons TaxID=7453 RepID=A0ABD2CSJ6_VESMC
MEENNTTLLVTLISRILLYSVIIYLSHAHCNTSACARCCNIFNIMMHSTAVFTKNGHTLSIHTDQKPIKIISAIHLSICDITKYKLEIQYVSTIVKCYTYGYNVVW